MNSTPIIINKMATMSYNELVTNMEILYPNMIHIYTLKSVSDKSDNYDPNDETFYSETEDELYYSDDNGDLNNVLDDYMNISYQTIVIYPLEILKLW